MRGNFNCNDAPKPSHQGHIHLSSRAHLRPRHPAVDQQRFLNTYAVEGLLGVFGDYQFFDLLQHTGPSAL